MPKLILVRHGFVEGIDPERFRGREDVPLSELGAEQARLLAARIAKEWSAAVVYTSPLQRCVQTGQAIAGACDVPLQVQNALMDIDYGDWQWQSHQEVRSRFPEEFARWVGTPHLLRFPNGESLQDLAARTTEWLRWLLGLYTAETVVIVGHESTNRALLLQMLDLPLSDYRQISQDPCGLNEIDISGHGVKVLRVNDTRHLHPLAQQLRGPR